MTTALSVIDTYDANEDFKDMRAKDHILPRAALMQPTSPDVVEGKAAGGSIVDSSTGTVLVASKEEGKYIVPIMMWLEWIEWNKNRDCDKDKRVVERSVDPASNLAKRAERWETFIDTNGKERPVVTEYYNFIVAIVDEKMSDYESLYILPFARSSHKIGKTLLNRLWKMKIPGADGIPVKAPMFLNRIAIKTQIETNENNKYFIPVFGDSRQNPEAHLALLSKIATDMRARRADIVDRNRSDNHDTDGAAPNKAGTAAAEM